MKACSNDLRRKIVSAHERGHRSQREIAELFGVSPATVRDFVRRKRARGTPDVLPRGGGARAQIFVNQEVRLIPRPNRPKFFRRLSSAPLRAFGENSLADGCQVPNISWLTCAPWWSCC